MIERENPSGLHRLGGVSLAVRADNLVFLAGQVPTDASGRVVGDDAEAQLRQVFQNIRVACEAMGGGIHSVVKTTTMLTDPSYYDILVRLRSEVYGDAPPANSTIVLPQLARPEWLVEVEAIAWIPSTRPNTDG